MISLVDMLSHTYYISANEENIKHFSESRPNIESKYDLERWWVEATKKEDGKVK